MLALPSGQKLALQAHLESVLAEEDWRRGMGEELTPEGLYQLVLKATGSKSAADRAMRDRISRDLRASAGAAPPV